MTARKLRKKYRDLSQLDKQKIIAHIKSGKSKNSLFQTGEFTKQAIDYVVEDSGIKYENKQAFPKRKPKTKPAPIRTEDIPRLCAEEMPPLHKMLNKVWKPTGVRA